MLLCTAVDKFLSMAQLVGGRQAKILLHSGGVDKLCNTRGVLRAERPQTDGILAPEVGLYFSASPFEPTKHAVENEVFCRHVHGEE